MSEAEWLSATDPTPMLEFLRGKASDRKLRLFACGVCRQLNSFVGIEESIRGIEEAECFADGQRTKAAMKRARQTLEKRMLSKEFNEIFLCFVAMCDKDYRNILRHMSYEANPHGNPYKELATKTPSVVREIFGNPFRPVALNPSWLTSTVLALATGIYEDRAFDRMPILTDALQDAGCDNDDILYHCRQPGEHVRGCWVVDLLLKK